MSILYINDFTGFSFGGVHSSTLGIYSVSNGNRYNRDLLPAQKDSIVDVTGRDGAYFLGSSLQTGSISFDLAYDHVEEDQIREIRYLFGDGKIKDLILDENPYKVYHAKVTTKPTMNFICFEERGRRIYKGEMKLTFTYYNPYATSRFKWLQDYREHTTEYNNVDEWARASGMLEIPDGLDEFIDSGFRLYNPGDTDTNYFLTFVRNSDILKIRFKLEEKKFLIDFNEAPKLQSSEQALITIDSDKKLLTQKNLVTGRTFVINNCQREGQIFKIPIGYSNLDLRIVNGAMEQEIIDEIEDVNIEYDYLYL